MAPTKLTGRIHGASLVDPALHSQEIEELLKTEVSRTFVEYIVERVIDVVDYALGRPSSSARGRSQGAPDSRRTVHTEFAAFAKTVIERAGVQLPVLLGTLVYLDRARPHLQLSLEEWACERVFLGALICANKYLNDSTLKNVHWSLCTGLFNKRDVGRIEREFLDVLDFELAVSEGDVLTHYEPVMLLRRPQPARLRIPTRTSSVSSRPALTRHNSSSTDSSMEDDSPGSTDSGSLPPTPSDVAQDNNVAVYVRSLTKYSPEQDDADSDSVRRSRSFRSSSKEPVNKVKGESGHHRLSSAFNLLRSIHKPSFHHSHSST